MTQRVDATRPTQPGDAEPTVDDVVRGLREVASLGREVVRQLRLRTRVGVVAIVAVVLVFGALALWIVTDQSRLRRVVEHDCGAFREIATLDVPPDPAAPLHQIVVTFRDAYDGRCTRLGPLPPLHVAVPSPQPS